MRASRRGPAARPAGAAAAALRVTRGARPPIAGGIVGGAHQRGHRLRDGLPSLAGARGGDPGGDPGRRRRRPLGGVGLERAGFRDFVVLELEDAPGGTSRSGESPCQRRTRGARTTCPSRRRATAPLVRAPRGGRRGRRPRRAGAPVPAEEALCREPQERVFFAGEWYEGLYPRVAARGRRTSRSSSASRRRCGARGAAATPRPARVRDPVARGSARRRSSLALDRVSRWPTGCDAQGFTSPRLRWFVEYACRDDFGVLARADVSAWAGLHYFASRSAAPATSRAEFLTWPEGNGRLVAHLAQLRERAAATPARSSTDVRRAADGAGVALTTTTRAGDGARGVRAAASIFALPRFVARRARAPGATRRRRGDELPLRPWMVANLTLRDRPRSRGFPLAWDNVLYESASLGYVVATHQTRPRRTARPSGPSTGRSSDDDAAARRASALLAAPLGDWRDAVLADLAPAHRGLAERVERDRRAAAGATRWCGRARARLERGARARGAPARAAVHFAHTDLAGLALFEEAQYHGVRAAEAVMRTRGTPSGAGSSSYSQ